MNLVTDHLELIPFAPQHLLALIEGTEQFTAASGLKVDEGLRDLFVSGAVSEEWIEQMKQATKTDPWMHGFAVRERDSGLVIGSGGFKGPPDESGEVEIGYGIAPAYQGRGYATEVAQALIRYAQQDGRVKTITAHTLPERNASGRVLTKCGFTLTGQVEDPDDGPVWRWARAAQRN